jgi:hypothetical protein
VAKDETDTPVEGTFVYDPPQGTALDQGTHQLHVTFAPADPQTYQGATATASIVATASPRVTVSGKVKFGDSPLKCIKIKFVDLEKHEECDAETNEYGCFTKDVFLEHNIRIEFPSCITFQGQALSLKGPRRIFCRPCKSIALPDVLYESRGCQISGSIKSEAAGGSCTPLPGVRVTLRKPDDRNTTGAETTTNNYGDFCFYTEQTGLLSLGFDKHVVDGIQYFPSDDTVDVFVAPDCASGVCVPTLIYTSALAQLCGQVTDGARGLDCVQVSLFDASGKCLCSRQTAAGGLWSFTNLPLGTYEVSFPEHISINGKSLELPEQQQTQTHKIITAGVKQADAVAYQPEPHVIEWHVLVDDEPAEGILVDVRYPGARSARLLNRYKNHKRPLARASRQSAGARCHAGCRV